jgi:phage tail sheath protein FI
MASFYNTPGVFIEEIPKLPPSVAPVETAIPAFVGYTEIAADIAPDDLLKKPKRIGSMVEFVLYYGSGPSLTVSEVNIDDVNNFKSAVISSAYYMYDSLRLFYANGGGDCYIVSIGKYGAAVDDVQLSLGTDALLKVDEPTLLLFPDAVVLTDDLLANVQTHALAHCADDSRKDRMAILDLKENDPKGVTFRSKIGVQFLSYGAAYTPWLKTNLPKKVTYADIATHIKRNGAAVTLPGLTPDVALQTQITELGKVYADKANIIAKTNLLASPSANLRDRYAVLVATYNAAKTVSNFQAIMAYVMSIVIKLDDFLEVGNADIITNAALLASVQSPILTTFKPIAQSIVALDKGAKAKWGAGYSTQATAANFTDATWGAGFVAGVVASGILTAATDPENTDLAVNALNPVFDSLTRSYLSLVVGAASAAATNADSALELAFPVYKSILKGVSTYVSNVPPSGAIAGIYASTDRTRGVWKAPANVSLSNVIEPTVTFTKTELDALNVDVTAGKSVNAIRTFFGKGTLVYGARTLAGNDNEWRYVPVRRLFIMVEESVKKATEQFVFEPNDANTWVKVQAMIENFLYNIWRQGALQGAKPEQAFYVAVGLNKTMNPIDILEGRMIVEIGMAAVRPAEFIVLQFSHKMAES